MFSLDRFYKIIHNNLIEPIDRSRSFYFFPFGTYNIQITLKDTIDTIPDPDNVPWGKMGFFHCYFFDQEPFYDFTKLIFNKKRVSFKHVQHSNRFNIIAVSEHSKLIHEYAKSENYYIWYYFFHGFAALDWYRDFQYFEPQSFDRFDKVFICYNHLTSNLRSYRLHLVSNLIEQGLIKYGRVSLFHNGWQETIRDPLNPLDNRARLKIKNTLKHIKEPLIIDTDSPTGTLSATVNFDDLTSAMWHVVTETIYFDPKLHLTEKIFKPIVAKRPFILVGAPGNLAYLKSYGFKTFNRWIDESYDLEEDHYIRIEKITLEIAKLCAMSPALLEQVFQEMQEVLEYNFNHFYGNFKDIIVDELVDNFEQIVNTVGIESDNLVEVKKRLKQ
jgi:hypothetical protein